MTPDFATEALRLLTGHYLVQRANASGLTRGKAYVDPLNQRTYEFLSRNGIIVPPPSTTHSPPSRPTAVNAATQARPESKLTLIPGGAPLADGFEEGEGWIA